MDSVSAYTVRSQRGHSLSFNGVLLISVEALNHDDTVRRRFCVYRSEAGYVAERIDDPGTIDVRYWGAPCADAPALYEFFGNEPLANYLYGALGMSVPGLRREGSRVLLNPVAVRR